MNMSEVAESFNSCFVFPAAPPISGISTEVTPYTLGKHHCDVYYRIALEHRRSGTGAMDSPYRKELEVAIGVVTQAARISQEVLPDQDKGAIEKDGDLGPVTVGDFAI